MTEVPSYKDLWMPTLNAVRELGGSGSIQEIFDKMVEMEGYPEEVLSIPAADGRRSKLEYRSHWARTYLKNALALENSTRGVWTLTKDGKSIRQEELEDRIREYNRIRRLASGASIESDRDPDSQESAEEDVYRWQERLISVLRDMDPSAFERLAQRILRESGFIEVKVSGQPGDGGIDGSGILRINLISFHVYFQCKRYTGSVGPEKVRDFRGAMEGRADKGLIITTGHFSSQARAEATRDGASAIDLIDGESLCELLKDLSLGVATRQVEEVTIDADWFNDV